MRIAVAMLVAGSLAPPATAAAGATVLLENIAFSRPSLSIGKGEKVVWRSKDRNTAHNVKSRGRPRFKGSGTLRDGDTHAVRFRRAGTYRYVCTIHPAAMRGEIVVG